MTLAQIPAGNNDYTRYPAPFGFAGDWSFSNYQKSQGCTPGGGFWRTWDPNLPPEATFAGKTYSGPVLYLPYEVTRGDSNVNGATGLAIQSEDGATTFDSLIPGTAALRALNLDLETEFP